MLAPWLNVQVDVRRRDPNAPRNSLNEADYGDDGSGPAPASGPTGGNAIGGAHLGQGPVSGASQGSASRYPLVYAGLWVRIEYWDEQMQFTQVGQRVVPTHLDMYVEPEYTIQAEDRVTGTSADATMIAGQLYIVTAAYPEWGSVGNQHHTIAELSIH